MVISGKHEVAVFTGKKELIDLLTYINCREDFKSLERRKVLLP